MSGLTDLARAEAALRAAEERVRVDASPENLGRLERARFWVRVLREAQQRTDTQQTSGTKGTDTGDGGQAPGEG